MVKDLPQELRPRRWLEATISGSELEDTMQEIGYLSATEFTERENLSPRTVSVNIRDNNLGVVRVMNKGHSYFLLSPENQKDIKDSLKGKRIDYDYILSKIDEEKKYTFHELAGILARAKEEKNGWLLTIRRLIKFGMPYTTRDGTKAIEGNEAIAFLQRWKDVYSKTRLASKLGFDLRIVDRLFSDKEAFDHLIDLEYIRLYPLVHRDETQYYVPEDKLAALREWIDNYRLPQTGAKGKYIGKVLFERIDDWRGNLNGNPFTVKGLNNRFPGTRSVIRHRYRTFKAALAAADAYIERRDLRQEGYEPLGQLLTRPVYKIFIFLEGNARTVNADLLRRIKALDNRSRNRVFRHEKTGTYYRADNLVQVQSLIEAAAMKEFSVILELERNSVRVYRSR